MYNNNKIYRNLIQSNYIVYCKNKNNIIYGTNTWIIKTDISNVSNKTLKFLKSLISRLEEPKDNTTYIYKNNNVKKHYADYKELLTDIKSNSIVEGKHDYVKVTNEIHKKRDGFTIRYIIKDTKSLIVLNDNLYRMVNYKKGVVTKNSGEYKAVYFLEEEKEDNFIMILPIRMF